MKLQLSIRAMNQSRGISILSISISLVCPQMPFYRILLVTRNDLAVASLYNKFVETAKYVINNGGVFQRIYNTGNQIFR